MFGLCHLFGFRFAPRIRDIKERKLYLLPDQKAPTSLKPLVGGVIDTEHITAHWDQLLRLATSIRTGTTTSSAMLKKLSAYPRQNGLAKALREIGRIERTLFTLDWIKNPTSAAAPISASTRAKRATRWPAPSTSAGSARCATAASRTSSSAPPGSTCWSRPSSSGTRSIWRWPIRELRRQGRTINEDLFRHVAPLGWEHIGLTGDYVWSTADQPRAGTLRPLRQRQSLLAA